MGKQRVRTRHHQAAQRREGEDRTNDGDLGGKQGVGVGIADTEEANAEGDKGIAQETLEEGHRAIEWCERRRQSRRKAVRRGEDAPDSNLE